MIPKRTKVRIGIDTGAALVVNNGAAAASREPLFLGKPANIAAKCAFQPDVAAAYPICRTTRESPSDSPPRITGRTVTTARHLHLIKSPRARREAKLDRTKESIIKEWAKEQEDSPIGDVEFSRPAPPLRNLDIREGLFFGEFQAIRWLFGGTRTLTASRRM